jgi:hypothetical protein
MVRIMTNYDSLHESLFDAADPQLVAEASKAMHDFTLEQMYRLWHIPMKYFIDQDAAALETLSTELLKHGHIDLDAAGTPCCLSGRPSVLNQS